MKVLHIVKTAVGAEWVYHLVRVLGTLGVENVVALPSDTEGFAPKYREAGAVVVRADVDFPSQHPWRLPAVLRRCRELVAQTQPQIIHTHHVGTTYVARLALGKDSPIPRAFQVAGPLHLEHYFFSRTDISLAGPRDYWIATCRWTQREYLRLGIPERRVFQTFAGTDIHMFSARPRGKLRTQLNLAPDVPLIGIVAYMYAPKYYIGQTRGLKGHEDFIAAFRIVQREMPRARAVVVGGPWGGATGYERRLRRLGAQACGDNLIFVGHRRDIPEIYPDLSLAVVPSLSENLGGAAEPLLSSVAVVATNVGGLPDLIQDGETGWLVPPRNPEALAAAVLDALQHPEEARRRTEKGHFLATHILDAERTSREVAGFYEQILAQCRDRAVAFASVSREVPSGAQPRPVSVGISPPQAISPARPIKALHIVKTAIGATWVLDQIRVLRSLNIDVAVALPVHNEGLAPKYRELGAEVIETDLDFPAAKPWMLPRVFHECRALVASTAPDIIHTHHVGTTMIVRLALGKNSKIPRVYWAAGGLHLEHIPFALMDVGLAGPNDYWIAINQWIFDRYLRMGVPRDRIAFSRNGFNVAAYKPTRTGKLRRELGISEQVPLVGMISYIYGPKLILLQRRGVKGHEDFIEAFKQVLQHKPDARAVVVGGTWDNAQRYEARLRATAKEQVGNAMQFIGHRRDVAEILPDFDVAVQPSLSEGTPHTVAQALLCGVPVVATSVGGLPEIIRPGETGWLVPPRRPEELSRAILEALNQPLEAKRRAANGAELVRTEMAFEKTGRELAEIYWSILRTAPGAS